MRFRRRDHRKGSEQRLRREIEPKRNRERERASFDLSKSQTALIALIREERSEETSERELVNIC